MTTQLQYNVKHAKHGNVLKVFNMNKMQIRYSFIDYKTEKLADIEPLSVYMDKDIQNTMMKELKAYVEDKIFLIVKNDDKHHTIYLYHDGMCINTIINNMIMYHTIYKL